MPATMSAPMPSQHGVTHQLPLENKVLSPNNSFPVLYGLATRRTARQSPVGFCLSDSEHLAQKFTLWG